MNVPITVLILARDEEVNLPDCLHSVCGWADQALVVLDPRTTDRSRQVAAAAGATVVENLFRGYAQQREWALRSGSVRNTWVLVLDADERVTPELRRDVTAAVTGDAPHAAYGMRTRFIFYGRWMKHCWYGTWNLRLFRRDRARYEMREVHEHVLVDGTTGYLDGDLIHNDFKDMDSWIAKHNRYATLEAKEIVAGGVEERLAGNLFGTRVERRRWIKDRLWNRMPFRPLALFVYLYFVRLGVLDGRLGFRFCLMHAIFDAFTTAKVWESRWTTAHAAENYYRTVLAEDLARHPSERGMYPGAD
jgi:glycosyltransferase involved in cell wall biosynthesis